MKKLSLLTAVFIISFIGLNSCNNKTLDDSQLHVSSEANNFLNFYSKNYEEITTPPIKPAAKTRSKNDNDIVTIYVDFPEDTSEPIKELCEFVSTAQDFIALHRLTAAEFSTDDTGSEYKIEMSEDEAKQSLSPLVEQSKQYLYSKGMSENEIQDMLTENNVDETQLVPFVLLLINQECREMELAKINQQKAGFNFLQLFVTPCKAADLSAVFDCGMEALGVDFLFAAGTSVAKTWSTAVIKKVFKSVAQKALGPVGAVIAIGSFGWCLHNRGYTCTYSVSTHVEEEFNKLNDKMGRIPLDDSTSQPIELK